MSFKFEKLKVWSIALDLSNEADKMALTFPRHELYSLYSQIKHAANSVVLNIAEGSTLQTDAEFKRFLVIANRSALEGVACLHIAIKRAYIEKTLFNHLYNGYLNLVRQIQALIKSFTKN